MTPEEEKECLADLKSSSEEARSFMEKSGQGGHIVFITYVASCMGLKGYNYEQILALMKLENALAQEARLNVQH